MAIGTDIEASVLTVLALSELGVKDIWAKALGEKHGRILERTGAHHVVYPEAAMGERKELRVIHGFGSGRLRKAIAEMLEGHPHVAAVRVGAEGRGGVTVVELKE